MTEKLQEVRKVVAAESSQQCQYNCRYNYQILHLCQEILKKYHHSIYNNCLPHIDVFMEHGYTKEEYKMIEETRKILHHPNLSVTATAVRVPVINCHSESINVELTEDFDLYDIRLLLENFPGILVVDDPEKNFYPLASKANGTDEVLVRKNSKRF